ncbi:hypothetical protein NDU88_005736 [Pleurodeles waltl]|uniref:Uncharacterized protein n=1 Tax=Pleurodeles waltl TaxID=8319 RepID=A0AAV7TVM3_PLEWA|nr:hypothetical protein NDU88_005736 [Pleurodeles waltl]
MQPTRVTERMLVEKPEKMTDSLRASHWTKSSKFRHSVQLDWGDLPAPNTDPCGSFGLPRCGAPEIHFGWLTLLSDRAVPSRSLRCAELVLAPLCPLQTRRVTTVLAG